MDQQPQSAQPKGSPVRQSFNGGGKKTTAIIASLIGIAVVVLIVNALVKKDEDGDNGNQNVGVVNGNQPAIITSNVDTSDWETYRNEELGVEFRYPDDVLIREGDEIDPVSGMKGNPNIVAGCYFVTLEDGDRSCNKGGFSIEIMTNLRVRDSFEGFDVIYSKYKEERAELGIGLPRLLSLRRVLVGQKEFYQAEYFGGDSYDIEVYIPDEDHLLVYDYDIYPVENDPQTEYHQQVAEAILTSLKSR